MENKDLSYQEEVPLYSIRIIRSYIDHLNKNYPQVCTDKLLEHAGISKFQYNDDGYWYNQRQANRFQEILVNETGNKNIALDAGRNLIKSQSVFAQYLFSFQNAGKVVSAIGKIYSKASKAATVSVRKIGENKYEFISKPNSGVKEQYYQCKNRKGSLEGTLKFIIHDYPTIEHPECYHRGDKYCRYLVYWEKPGETFKWKRIRNYLILLFLPISGLISFQLPLIYFLLSSTTFFSIILGVTQYANMLEEKRLKKNLEEVGNWAESHWHEYNVRYNTTKLFEEIGRVTSVKQNELEIISVILNELKQKLDFQRGFVILIDSSKCLFLSKSYGFTDEEISTINQSWLELGTQNESILQKVFKKQEPILIEDLNKGNDILNENDFEIAKKLKIQSMICVPIVHEDESLGVLIVDSHKSQKELREGDINLLMAVASQMALSIANARSFQKLQESEKKHRTLVETIRDIVYTVDLNGRFTYVSPLVGVVTGYADNELLGREFTEIINPPYKDLVMRKFADGLKTREIATYVTEILSKENKVIPVELNVAPLTNNKGQMIGRIGVVRDITRRYAEESKRQEMERKALTQDKLASLGEIATGVAHEINQPLSYIKIILESTLYDIEKEELDREELSGDFKESLRQVGKITNIISHLRTFGRSDVISFSPVNLSRVLDDTLILMHERLRIKNITIDIQLVENLPMLYGNHVKLEQLFVNLIQNSMDAIEEHGKGVIILTAEAENNEMLITYSDSGAGIDPMILEKIFEPFFTTKEAGKGTGIGLSIVYGIVQEHEGTITCESEIGKGAIFKIKLPTYQDDTDSLSEATFH